MADLKISALTASTTPLAGTEVLPIVQSSTTKQVSVANLTAGRAVQAASIGINMTAAYALDVTDNTTGQQGRFSSASSNGTSVAFTNTATNGRTWRVGTNYIVGNGEWSLYDSTAAKEVLRADSSQNVNVVQGNLVIGTSGNGIDFSATPGTGTSELFADYEEGTFTPVVAGSTSAGTATYALQVGNYTKIGRQVNIEVALSWSSGTGTGNLRITGLPYTSSNNTTVSGMAIAISDTLILTALNVLTAFVPANSTRVDAFQYPVGGGTANNVAYDSGATLYFSGSYSV
jgi:hypothetical protein